MLEKIVNMYGYYALQVVGFVEMIGNMITLLFSFSGKLIIHGIRTPLRRVLSFDLGPPMLRFSIEIYKQ